MSASGWLVTVPAGRWQVCGIKKARSLGYRVFALDGDSSAEGFAFSDRWHAVDIRKPQLVCEIVEAAGIKPSGALSLASEVGIPAVAQLSERFGLQAHAVELATLLTDKAAQRQRWTELGVPGPDWRTFSDVAEGTALARDFSFPFVTKPVDSAGSRGVSVVERPDEIESALKAAIEGSVSGRAIIEDYCAGTEYAVETFGDGAANHVLCVSEKTKVAGTRGTVAQELATPLSPTAERVAGEAALQALDALGYRRGPGHVEVIVSTDMRPFLVEAAGRGGGFMVFEQLVQQASGYDIVAATVQQAMGDRFSPVTVQRRAVALRFIPSTSGVVDRIEGLEAANSMEGVMAGALVQTNSAVAAASTDGDRLAYVLATCDTPLSAREKAAAAIRQIRIVIRPDANH